MSEMVKVSEVEVGDHVRLPGGSKGRVHVKAFIPSRANTEQIMLKIQLPIEPSWDRASYPSTAHTYEISEQAERVSKGIWHAP